MKKTMRLLFSVLFFLNLALMTPSSLALVLSKANLYDAAYDSYIYAYPLVIMDVSRSVMTNVPAPSDNRRAPINQFGHGKKFPTPDYHDFVRPNADTLYSFAWLDLSKEPIVLSVPDTNGRYYLLPMLDAWTEVFASPGKRTTGTGKGDYLIVGPNWKGEVPKNFEVIKAPTNIVWIMGRTLTINGNDYEHVYQIQKGYRLTPLSQWGREYIPPSNLPTDPSIDMSTPSDQVANMDAIQFFTRVAKALKFNQPHKEDSEVLKQLQAVGITPGQDFDASKLTKSQIIELNKAIRIALRDIRLYVQKNSEHRNGWLFTKITGEYGIAYMDRAAMAFSGLGANLQEDAIYPVALRDIDGELLSGKNRYVLHFSANQLPQVNGFWSVTMYGFDGYFVPNPINRYAMGDRDALQFNNDGSLDLYVQHYSPGVTKESNWLPAPEGSFNLTMRLYWPKQEVYGELWNPPSVLKY